VIALGVFGARPREVDSGGTQRGDVDGTLIFDIIAGRTLCVLWLVIGVWERYHLQHKLHADREMAGEAEKDEISHTEDTRRWLRLWRQLNVWITTQAVGVDEARTSPMYRWITAGVTWFSIASNFMTLGYVLAEKAPEAIFWYKFWTIGKYIAAVCATASVWCDLSDRPEGWLNRWDFAFYGCVLGEGVQLLTAIWMWPGTNVVNIVNLGITFFLSFTAVRMHRRALAASTLADRRKHVLEVSARPPTPSHIPAHSSFALASNAQVVFPKTLQLAFPFIVISCEMLSCESGVYMDVTANTANTTNTTGSSGSFADVVEGITEDFGECDGVILGCTPLLTMLMFVYLSQVLYVDSETAFTVVAIARFRFGLVKLFQLALMGACSIYALVMYVAVGHGNTNRTHLTPRPSQVLP
jgi:hypothetical protein